MSSPTPPIALGAIDMNLFVALDALLAERNVTRAAARLGISPSAMSHALARLRSLTGDELFIRRGREMEPTARAAEFLAPIHKALGEIAHVLAPPPQFDPKSLRVRVDIAMSDYVELVLLPGVLGRLAAEAPGVELRIVPLQDDLGRLLASGAVSLAVAPVRATDVLAGLASRALFADRLVCVVRRRHPLAQGKLTIDGYAAASHVLVATQGAEVGAVDIALASLGLRRQVALTVPHLLVAPHLIAATDLVLTLPERLARVLARPLGLALLRPPRELGLHTVTISALWHERTQEAADLCWVRGLFEAQASVLRRPHASRPDSPHRS
jgi:DNA-binding transcriptional LysR family regulator